MHHFKAEVFLPQPREVVFDFFSDARNLGLITPAWLQFAVTSNHDLTMRQGLLVDYRIKLHGIPMSWQSEISVWEPSHRFIDEQRVGPYRTWIHEHTFEEVEGGTLVRDTVRYSSRGGPLMHRWFVRPSIDEIFSFRTRKLVELFHPTAGRALQLQTA